MKLEWPVFDRRRLTSLTLIGILALGGTVSSAAASVMIRVSQESAAGAGDFDANVLGFVDSFLTGLTIAGFYQYGTPNRASYNGELNGGPLPISSTTQGFFVSAFDGLHYVVVHDNPNDGSGGSARMTTTLGGGAGGAAAFVVEDDPGEGTTVTDIGTDRVFDTAQNWVACCTDGYAIGALSLDSVLFAEFDAVAGAVNPLGIDVWRTSSSFLPHIATVLDPGRRVRYDMIVPAPASLALSGISITVLGLVGALRRRRQLLAA